jgi:hypothetical protein
MSTQVARNETEAERADRNLTELLQELRVASIGVQVLFGFLLAIPSVRGSSNSIMLSGSFTLPACYWQHCQRLCCWDQSPITVCCSASVKRSISSGPPT